MITAIDQYVVEKVREIRRKKKISQSQLAFELDLSTGFIKNIECGKSKYNVSHLNEIAKLLNCKICDFFPEKPL